MVLCGLVTLPPRHCGSISKVSLANLEAVWGSYWAQDTHSVFNLPLYLSLGFILYTSSLSFLFLFFLNLLWVQRFTSSTLRFCPRGPWRCRRKKIGEEEAEERRRCPADSGWCALVVVRYLTVFWSPHDWAPFLPCLCQSYHTI